MQKWKAVNQAECDLLEKQWIGEDCMNAIMNFFMQQQSKKKQPKSKL
jgi:hypothetical protein